MLRKASFMIAALSALVVSACGSDRGRCLRSHQERYTALVRVGRSWLPRQATRTVCDEWEFPNGRPQREKP